ncbi:hypothetical protein F5Y16DRAFT_406533 [Xylariaceae sp. FL0255]|nr:hypothetical protein F5Y16DRAFT_406533 [Xylariaceae sp. FL0255]
MPYHVAALEYPFCCKIGPYFNISGQNTTLRHVLSRQKPIIPCLMTETRNTVYKKWTELVDVTIWEEFNFANFSESYGHVLDIPVSEELAIPRPDQEFRGMTVEKDDDLRPLIVWNGKLMDTTLQVALPYIGLDSNVALRQIYWTPDNPKPVNLSKGRPSSRWSGRRLANELNDPKQEHLSPLRQLANACNVADTRYGYIQTDEEMVMCRVNKNKEGCNVAMMPVPWSRKGINVLTTDLALWWLCMLALSCPENRAIVEDANIAEINAWEESVKVNDARGYVRRHKYSRVEVPALLPVQTSNEVFNMGGLSPNTGWDTLMSQHPAYGSFEFPGAEYDVAHE